MGASFSYKGVDDEIILEPLQGENILRAAELHLDEKLYHHGYRGGMEYVPKNLGEALSLIEKKMASSTFTWSVTSQNNGFVGITGVRNIEKPVIEIGGTAFNSNFWGLGYNHITKLLVMDLVHRNNFSTVIYAVNPINNFSAKSLERLGAQMSHVKPSHIFPDLVYDVYKIDLNEWCETYKVHIAQIHNFNQNF